MDRRAGENGKSISELLMHQGQSGRGRYSGTRKEKIEHGDLIKVCGAGGYKSRFPTTISQLIFHKTPSPTVVVRGHV